MPLLERNTLLRRLEEFLDEAEKGSGRLVSLLGEAGVGKSTVAQALANDASARVRVLWGACEDLSTPQPLGPLHDLMRGADWAVPSGDGAQLGLFGAVLEKLMTQPTLVVLEDLHWADDATLDLVRYLGRRIQHTQVMLLLTARNDTTEAQIRLRRALVNVPADVAVRIEVPRLSHAAVNAMAREYGQDGAAIYALTGGNAFLSMEILRSGDESPESVRDALLLRAERLSPGARKALDAASIFPRRVEDWLFNAVCDARAENHISECIALGLLSAEQGYYAFRHEIARRAIEEALAPAERVQLNKRALDELSQRAPEAIARLVHHAVAARDAEAVCALAPRAAEEAARMGAHRQAAQHYAAAISYAHILPPERRAELLERSAFELQLVGRVNDAIDAHKAALALRRQIGDELKAGDELRWLARLSYNVGERADAEAFAKAAISALEGLGPTPELAMAYANFALITALNDESATAVEWAGKTIELSRQLGRTDILADAFATLGIARQWVDYEGSCADFEEGLRLALQLNREEIVARIYANASCIALNTWHGARAHELFDAGIAYCASRDLETWLGYMRGWRAELLIREGKWDAARTLATGVLEMPTASQLLRFPSMVALARLRVRTGAEEAAILLADLTWSSEPQRLLIYAPVFGEGAWVDDIERDQALAVLARAAPVAERIGNIWAAGEIAYWRWKLGEPLVAPAHVARPYQLLFAGDWEGAAEAWAELEAPYEQALALLEGDEQSCARGLAMLDTLGAWAVAERARKALRQRGVRSVARGPRASTRANAAGLTRRQMDVLRLIDEGLSNAEIAERLYVSVKTVDQHVSAVLEKLDVASRGEAVARARENGLFDGNEGGESN